MLLDWQALGSWRWPLLALGVAVAIFLLLPILFIAALSFGNSPWLIFPPPGWTLRWYQQLLGDGAWMAAAGRSVGIGLATMVAAVLLAVPGAFALCRGRFPGRGLLRGLFVMPMILPLVVFAVALYMVFLRIGLHGTVFGFIAAHTVLAFPFAFVPIAAALEQFDPAIEDAAILCGASPWRARLAVTLPGIRLGVASGAIFAFLASWDEVVVSIFMASPSLQTLPVRIWTVLRQDLSPVVAAASTLTILMTILLMALVALMRRHARPKAP